MTVHGAKGLEFGVVAVADLARRLLAGARRRADPRTRGAAAGRPAAAPPRRRRDRPLRLRASSARRRSEREAEEELRLFHVAATRARERLILSGVVKPEPAARRSGDAGGRAARRGARDRRATPTRRVAVPPPQPRRGSRRASSPREIAVRVNLPSPERAAELPRAARGRRAGVGEGPPPLLERRPPASPAALSPTPRSPPTRSAATASRWSGCWASAIERAPTDSRGTADAERRSLGARRTDARGASPSTPCSSGARPTAGGRPPADLMRRHAARCGAGPRGPSSCGAADAGPRLAWLASARADRAGATASAPRCRSCSPSPAPLRGSIDLLVERTASAPGDRLQDRPPRRARARGARRPYATQRAIYALAVAGPAPRGRGRLRLPRAPEAPVLTLLNGRRWPPPAPSGNND